MHSGSQCGVSSVDPITRHTPARLFQCTTSTTVTATAATTASNQTVFLKTLRCTHRVCSKHSASDSRHDTRLGHARIRPVILERIHGPVGVKGKSPALTFPVRGPKSKLVMPSVLSMTRGSSELYSALRTR